ncbi:hypothetical protein ACFLVJ_02980 [Chloroflexota bacterium]
MPKTYDFFLRVREADEVDFGTSIIRIHTNNKPQEIEWGESINISIDKKNWITCNLKPAGATGIGHIYIGIHTRRLINQHNRGINRVILNEPSSFYIKKVIPWKAIKFIVFGSIIAAITLSLVFSRWLL